MLSRQKPDKPCGMVRPINQKKLQKRFILLTSTKLSESKIMIYMIKNNGRSEDLEKIAGK